MGEHFPACQRTNKEESLINPEIISLKTIIECQIREIDVAGQCQWVLSGLVLHNHSWPLPDKSREVESEINNQLTKPSQTNIHGSVLGEGSGSYSLCRKNSTALCVRTEQALSTVPL